MLVLLSIVNSIAVTLIVGDIYLSIYWFFCYSRFNIISSFFVITILIGDNIDDVKIVIMAIMIKK